MKTAIELADMLTAGSGLIRNDLLEAAAVLRQQAEQIEQLEVERLRLAGEVSNRNQRALEGDKSTAAFNTLYDEFEALRVERDALKALVDNPRSSAFGKEAEKLADDWLAANAPGGWIDDLRNKCEALEITNDALKADAERYRKIKTSFVWDNENSHGHWVCYITSPLWGPDGEPDAAIDAMKGKS